MDARTGRIGIGGSHLSSPPTPPDKRVRIRRFDGLLPCRTAQRPEVRRTHRRWWFRRSSSSIAGFTRSQLAQSSTRRLIGWRMATHETRFLMPLLIVQAFVPRGTTVPSADFCRTVRVNCSTLSPDSGTCNRSPAIRLTAFNAQPPNLPPAPLMDLDFAVIGQLVRRRRPHIRFLSIGSRLCSTLPSDPASRRQPLRFAITYPPSGCEGDLHPQAINHARRTKEGVGP